jgi:peptide/nickel transport system permease protein
MLGLIGRRLAYLVPVVFAVTALTFLIANLLPGDLAIAMLGDQATPENVAALHKQLGLDLPLWQQYLHWLGGVLRGDFGTSYRTGETVLHAIAGRLPVSLELLVMAELGGLVIGVPLAILCAVRPGSVFDRIVSSIAFGTLSIPPFMLAIVLIFIFSLRLGVLPATAYVPLSQDVLGNLRSMALPGATLALLEWPTMMRVLRTDMISTLQEDYIALARAKGLPSRRILLVHALKPSSLTLVTVLGINIGRLIGGALITEVIFALPGVGRLLVESIYLRDFVILQGGVLLVAIGFVLVNFLVDLLYAVLDPRIRHGRA